MAVGAIAALGAWFFETQLKNFIDDSPWAIPLFAAIGISGLMFWFEYGR